MLDIKGLLVAILTIVLLSSIQSLADTFVVTNLNDPELEKDLGNKRAFLLKNLTKGEQYMLNS